MAEAHRGLLGPRRSAQRHHGQHPRHMILSPTPSTERGGDGVANTTSLGGTGFLSLCLRALPEPSDFAN